MKISVIIPAYNAEKFLPVCLESLLIQTFADFEVIVVDDCSTDSTCAVAENFFARFGGRLKIISLPQNTGSGSVPRNVGLEHARGDYVYFMDNDDLLIDIALETLYDFAEEFGADVVYMEKFFKCNEEPVPKNLEVFVLHQDGLIDEPTLESDDLKRRLENFFAQKFYWSPWAKFLKRSLLVDNKIFLPQMTIADDTAWTFKIICLAKKILHIPTPLYVWRTNTNSFLRRKRTPEETIKFFMNPLINGVEYLDEFMRGAAFFRRNPVLRLQTLNFFVNMQFDYMQESVKNLSAAKVYEIFLREFTAASSTQPALISYLLLMTNLYRNELTE